MPVFNFRCTICGKDSKKLLTPDKAADLFFCKECNSPLARNTIPPSSRTTEVIDTGFNVKKIEIVSDITRIMKERSEKAKRKDKPE